MNAILDPMLGMNLSANIQFVTLLLVGLFVGWLMARPCGMSCWATTLLMVGISGAWLGAELTHLLGQGPRGGVGQLLAAMAGAVLLTHSWRRFHPRPD